MKRKHLLLIMFSVGILACGIGIVIWRYSAATGKGTFLVLQVKLADPTVWSANEKPDREEFERYKRNLEAFAKAPFVIAKVLSDRTVSELPLVKQHGPDAASWLADQIVVNNPLDSELMEIGMLDSDQQQASVIVNALGNAFVSEIVEKARTDRLVRRDNLEKKFRAYKSNVQRKAQDLFTLNQEIGTTDAETAKTRRRIEVADLEALMQSRAESQKAIAELTLKIELAKAMIGSAEKGNVSDAQMDEAIAKDPQIMQAVNDLNALRREEREIKNGTTTDRLAAEADRAELQAELQIARGKHKLEGLADSSSEYKAAKSEIDLAEVDRKFWSEKAANLSEQNREKAKLRIRNAIASVEQSMEEFRNTDRQKLIDAIKRESEQAGANIKALELQRDLYMKRLDATTQDIARQAESVQKLEKFNGDADQLRIEIAQLQNVVNEMGNTLTKWNIELDAGDRVMIREKAHSD